MNTYEHIRFNGESYTRDGLEIHVYNSSTSDFRDNDPEPDKDSSIEVNVVSGHDDVAFEVRNPEELMEVAQILGRIAAGMLQKQDSQSGDAAES